MKDGTITDGWTFLGRVESAKSAELATAVPGRVLAVKVREGDRVRAKQTLLTLDSAKIRAELDASRAKEQSLLAELAYARKQVERVENLDYKAAISIPERERIALEATKLDAQLSGQRAETRRLQVEYARHSLQAPFEGVISARHVDPGAWVSTGTPVLALVSLDDLEIHTDVSAELSSRIQTGQTVHLLGPTRTKAEIAGIVGVLDASTRTMRVRLSPVERPAWLLSGMAVDVEFSVTLDRETLGRSVLLVPRDALVRGPVRTRVIKFDDGNAVPVYVAVLATVKEQALVHPEPDEPDLVVGDRIVVRGNERLRPGQSLRVAE